MSTTEISSTDNVQLEPRAAPRALLAMNGDLDFDQPKFYTLCWLRVACPAYAAAPERLRLNVCPVAHTLTEQMEQDAVAWLAQYLSVRFHWV